jgi:fibronectin-binding autotransporter adhesin
MTEKYTRAVGPQSSRPPSRWVKRLSSWLVLSTALTLGHSQAASLYWDGTGTTWNSPANWSTVSGATTPDPLLVPGSADLAIFNTTGLISSQTVTLDADQSALGLVFNSTGPVGIEGTNTLTLGSSGITVDSSAGADIVNANVSLASAQSWTNGSASLFTISGNVANGANLLTLSASGSGGILLAGNFVGGGAGGITVNGAGPGMVAFSGANTFTGPLTVAGGNVTATSNAGALGATTAALNLVAGNLTLTNASGSNIAFTNGATTVSGTTTITSDVAVAGTAANTYTLNALNIGGQLLNVVRGANATGTAGVTFGGVATLTANGSTFDVGANSNLTLTTLTGAFSLFKQGAGTLTLAGTAGTRASGNAYVTAGTFVIAGSGNGSTSDAFGSAAVPTVILSGGTTLDLASGTDAATSVAAHPVHLLGSATILSNANTPATAGFQQTMGALSVMNVGTAAKSLTIGAGANITGTGTVGFSTGFLNAATNFSVNAGAQLIFSGAVTNNGNAITFSGAGNSTVGGLVGGGGVTMNGTGTLTLNGGNSSYTGGTIINSGTVVLGNVQGLGISTTATAFDTTNVSLTGASTLNLNNFSPFISAISATSGTIIQNGGSTTDSTVTIVPGANSTSILAGTLQDGSGGKKLAVAINGQGAVTLGGNNTHTGVTTLIAGQLNLNSNTALGGGGLAWNAGIIDNTSGSAVALTTISSLTTGVSFGGTNNISFSGSVPQSGSRSIIEMGTSGKTLSFGGWIATGGATNGVLAVPGSNSIVNMGTYSTVATAGNTNVTLNVNGNLVMSGGIAPGAGGSGNMSLSGGGNLTISGASTWAGTTAVTGATLILDATVAGGASMPGAAPTLASGASFIFKGDNSSTGQTFTQLTLGTAAGSSTIQVNAGTSGTTLALGTFTTTTNGTMANIKLIDNGAGIAVVTSSTPVSANGIFGTRAAITVTAGGTTEFAGKSGTSIVQYTGQTVFTGTTSGTATNYSVADSQTLTTAASTPNTIKITTSVDDASLDLGANAMKITSGGILFTGANTGYEIKGTNAAALSSGTNAATPDLIIHNFGTGGLKISAVIANGGTGAQVLSVDGPGTTTLSAANTYTGQTWVSGGAVLSISNNNNLGLDTGTLAKLTLVNGTLQINTGDVSLSGTGGARAVDLTGVGGTFDTNGFNLTIAGVIAGAGSLTKTGSGNLYLSSAAATYTGPYTNIRNGSLQIGSASGIAAAATYVSFGSATTNTSGVLVLGDAAGIKDLTVTGGLFSLGTGTGNAIVNGNTLNSSVSTLTFTGSPAVPSTFNGSFGGAGANQNNLALKITSGVLTLSGSSTMNGGVSLAPTSSAGVMLLNINHSGALGIGTLTVGGTGLGNFGSMTIDNTSGGDITLNTNNAVTFSNQLTYGGTNSLNFGADSVVTQAASQSLMLMGNSNKALTFGTWNFSTPAKTLTVNALQGSSTSLNIGILNLNSSGTVGTATTINGAGMVNVTTITETAVGTPFTYSGSGTLTINGSANYTGVTSITGGMVKLGTSGNLPNTVLAMTGGVFDLNGRNQTVSKVTNAAALITNTSGTISTFTAADVASSNGSFAGNLNYDLTLATAAAASLSGNFTNAGNITLTNTNTTAVLLTLNSTNVLNGGNVTLKANGVGTIQVSAANFNPAGGTVTNSGIGSGLVTVSGVVGSNVTTINNTGSSPLSVTGAVYLNPGGLTVTQSGTGTLTLGSPAINGAGNLTVINNSATGALAFSAIPSFTGNLTFQANSTGTMTVSSANMNHSGTVTNSGSGTNSVVISGTIGPSVTGFIQNSASSKVTLAGANTYAGLTDVVAGKVIVSGSIAGSARVGAGANLASGNNTTSTIGGNVSLLSSGGAGGTLAPGDTGDTAGTTTIGLLNVNGNLAMGGAGAPARLAIEIGGSTGGTLFDQIQVAASGTVSLTNVNLELSLANNFDPTTLTPATYNTGTNQFDMNGTLLFIVKGSTMAVAGQFANEGAADPGLAGFGTYNLGGQYFAISYQANFGTGEFYDTDQGGHDIALMAIPEPHSAAMLVAGFAMALGVQRFRRRLM